MFNNMVSAMEPSKARRLATAYPEEILSTLSFVKAMEELELGQANGLFHGLEFTEYTEEPFRKKIPIKINWETASLQEISNFFVNIEKGNVQTASLCLPRFINSLIRITNNDEAKIIEALNEFIPNLSKIKSIDLSFNITMCPNNIDSIAPKYLEEIWKNLTKYCTVLEIIILDGNNIGLLYAEERFHTIFKNIKKMNKLKTLSLRKCNLTSSQKIADNQQGEIRLNISFIFDCCDKIKEIFLQGNYLHHLFNKDTLGFNLSYFTNLKKIEKIYIDNSMNLDLNKLDKAFSFVHKSCVLKKTSLWGTDDEYNHNSTWLEVNLCPRMS